LSELIRFIEFIQPVFEVKLKEEFQNKGIHSGQILLMERIKVYKELKKEFLK